MTYSDTPIFYEVLRDLTPLLGAPPRAIILGAEPLPGQAESAPLKVGATRTDRLPVKATRKRGTRGRS